jgi:hypothetical protein
VPVFSEIFLKPKIIKRQLQAVNRLLLLSWLVGERVLRPSILCIPSQVFGSHSAQQFLKIPLFIQTSSLPPLASPASACQRLPAPVPCRCGDRNSNGKHERVQRACFLEGGPLRFLQIRDRRHAVYSLVAAAATHPLLRVSYSWPLRRFVFCCRCLPQNVLIYIPCNI